jgi:molecular chaperone Hsp33
LDHVLPFQTESSHLRGRLVRLGPLLDDVLNRHAYPEPVARLLGEALVLAVALAATLKYDGIFTLQVKGDGPVGLLVADVVGSAGGGGRVVRGYARYDENAIPAEPACPLTRLVGQGYLAFTVDQGPDTERYQGIVSLTGDSLAACVQHYFHQSDQLPTGLQLAIDRNGGWRGTALLLQRLPRSGDPEPALADGPVEDDWRRAMVLMATLGAAELLDPALADEDLLYRLFHQDGVRVFPANGLTAGCRCSRERVALVLRSLDRGEVEGLRDNGLVAVTCEFCNARYTFDDDQLAVIYGEGADADPNQDTAP